MDEEDLGSLTDAQAGLIKEKSASAALIAAKAAYAAKKTSENLAAWETAKDALVSLRNSHRAGRAGLGVTGFDEAGVVVSKAGPGVK